MPSSLALAPPSPTDPRGPSRRSVLSGVAALGLGIVGGGRLLEQAHAGAARGPVQVPRSFVSTDLTLPAMTVEKRGETAPGYLFLAPRGDGGKAGVALDDSGQPVWIQPTDQTSITDVRLQQVGAEPMLTYWSGGSADGHGEGTVSVVDSRLRAQPAVTPVGGDTIDLHETKVTDRGTMLTIAYMPAQADLSSIGGPRDGWVYDTRVVERDLATSEPVLTWSPLEHLALEETYSTIADDVGTREKPFDVFHANAVEDRGDTLLICFRHTHSLVLIDRATGEVQWRMGGRRSDFDIPEGVRFSWQHDARWVDEQTLSLFDNHASEGSDPPRSRGLVLTVDQEEMTVRPRGIYQVGGITSNAEGSTQVLAGGNVVVGWGSVGRVHEFDPEGTPVLSVEMPDTHTYRAYRQEWTSRPGTKPDVVVRAEEGGTRAYVSWNGATEVTSWRVHTGASADSLAPGSSFERTGFESSVLVSSDGWLAVEALDADGRRLGMSDPVQASAG